MKKKKDKINKLAAELYSKVGSFDLRFIGDEGPPRWVLLIASGNGITRLSGTVCPTVEQALNAAVLRCFWNGHDERE